MIRTGMMESFASQFHLLVYLALICTHLAAGQQQQQQQPTLQKLQQAGQLDSNTVEQVDRLASAAGDFAWRPSPDQLEWILQTQYRKPSAALTSGYYVQAPQQAALFNLDGPTSNYHALMDEFKQYSSLANPSRESRAFKPKLMSTARGFGKRAQSASQQHISLNDLLAASNGAILSDGKISGEITSSKYADWIGQVLSRWPTMDKYVNDKYVDYNGNA